MEKPEADGTDKVLFYCNHMQNYLRCAGDDPRLGETMSWRAKPYAPMAA
jgi:hypothetical protein